MRAHLQPLVERERLRLASIERQLALAGNAAGLSLRSALKPGTRPGTTRLVVEGRSAWLSGSLSRDNSLPSSLGEHMVTASATLNNLAGLGERLSFTLGMPGDPTRLGSMTSPYTMFGTSLTLPLGHDGLSVTANYLQSRTLETASSSFLNSLGHFSRAGAAVNATLVASHDRNLIVSVGGDRTMQSAMLPSFGFELSRDDYASLRQGLQGWRLLSGDSYLSGALYLSQGLIGRATPLRSQLPLSQAGAQANYTKVDASFTWRASLDRATSFTLNAHGQSSFGAPLFVSEKITLAAPDGISATIPGLLEADTGLVLRDELARTIALRSESHALALSPYLFSSIGFGWNFQPGAPVKRFDVQAIGTGIRLATQVARARVGFALEYGHCFCGKALGADGNRLNLSATLGF